MGGGGPSTITQTTNNTPWNASQLSTIQNKAIDLMNNSPLSYYPSTTYQQPNDYQLQGMTDAGNLGLSAGNAASGALPGMQSGAMYNATNLADGGGFNHTLPEINSLYGTGVSASDMISPYLSGLFNQYAAGAGTGAGGLQGLASGGGQNQASPYINALNSLGLGQPGSGVSDMAGTASGQNIGQISPYLQGFGQLASGAQGTGTAALGQFANAASYNPYLNQAFNQAAQPLVNRYMEATAPQTDSAFESAGRFNGPSGTSGALSAARSNNEQNLGNSLAGLAAGIYEPAYEQNLGYQLQGAQALAGAQQNALQSGLQGLQSGQQLSAQTANQLASQQNSAFTNALSGLEQGQQIQGSAASNLGNLQNTALANAMSGQNSATGNTINAYNSALTGNLGTMNNQLQAIQQAPSLSQMPFTDLQAALNAGQNYQQIGQADINDQMQRFYGSQYSPYQTLNQAASVVGGAIPGMTSTQIPYFQPSPFGQAAGAAIAGAQLMSGGK